MTLVDFSEIKSVQYFTSLAKVPLIVLSQKVLRCIKESHGKRMFLPCAWNVMDGSTGRC